MLQLQVTAAFVENGQRWMLRHALLPMSLEVEGVDEGEYRILAQRLFQNVFDESLRFLLDEFVDFVLNLDTVLDEIHVQSICAEVLLDIGSEIILNGKLLAEVEAIRCEQGEEIG